MNAIDIRRPWTFGRSALPSGTVASPPPVPPAPPVTSKGPIPLIARDPTLEPRLRRVHEILSSIVNSLGRKGQIVKTGPDDYSIDGSAIDLTGLSGATGTFTDSF